MGMLSASTSFSRFRVTEDVPKDLWAEIPDRLKRFSFRDIDDGADERSWGWVCFDDMLDNHWRTAPPEKGGYFAFTLRLDTRRIAPAVFKKHLTIALAHELQLAKQDGRKFLSKDRKKEIKEQVRLKLMARTLPIPAIFETAWNIERNIVYMASTRSKVCDLFAEHFTLTFDLHLELLTPFTLGAHLLGKDYQNKLELVEAERFIA